MSPVWGLISRAFFKDESEVIYLHNKCLFRNPVGCFPRRMVFGINIFVQNRLPLKKIFSLYN